MTNQANHSNETTVNAWVLDYEPNFIALPDTISHQARIDRESAAIDAAAAKDRATNRVPFKIDATVPSHIKSL